MVYDDFSKKRKKLTQLWTSVLLRMVDFSKEDAGVSIEDFHFFHFLILTWQKRSDILTYVGAVVSLSASLCKLRPISFEVSESFF